MANAFHYQNTFNDELAQEFRSTLGVSSLNLLNPHDFWDFTDEDTLTLQGAAVKAIANKGSSNDAITHSTGNTITFDGTKCIGHQYANSYKAGAAGDRNFLHDGSGAEVFIIHKQAAATNEQYFYLSNDVSGSSYVPGARLSSMQNSGLALYTSRIGYNSNHLFSQSPDNSLTLDMPVIAHLKLNGGVTVGNVELREDGALLYRVPYNVSSVFVETDHNAPLQTFLAYTGDIYGMVMYDRILTDQERNYILRTLRKYYELPSVADVSLLIGASNALGIGSGSLIDPTYQNAAPRGYLYTHDDGDTNKPLTWWMYEQANSHIDHASSSGGLDLSLMHRLAAIRNNKQFLVKATIGGNDLYSDWNPDAAEGVKDGLNRLQSYLTPAISALEDWGFTLTYRACIIGLGENDASSETKAAAYAAIQARLNEVLRELTSASLPIMLVACSTEQPDDTSGRSDGNMQEQATIRTAQAQVAKRQHTTSTERSKKSRAKKKSDATDGNAMQRGATSRNATQRKNSEKAPDTDKDTEADTDSEENTDSDKNKEANKENRTREEKRESEREKQQIGGKPQNQILEQMLDIWNEEVQSKITQGQKAILTAKRKELLTLRFIDEFAEDIRAWRYFCEIIGRSEFCLGKIEGKDWTIDLTWAIQSSDRVAKILEGGFSGGKAVILVRVSTEEQEEGHSLDAQRARLVDYCERRNLQVLNSYTIIESSTRGDRKQFMEMLEFAKKQKQTIAIVADAVDRVQRSFKDSVYLDELIRQDKIELHFYREGMILNKDASASDIMRWDFSVMGAKSYVLQLSENVKRSLDWKLKKGECIGAAPLGYLNDRDENGNSTVVIDPVRGPIIQRFFHEYAKGTYTLADMARKCKQWGLRSKKGHYVNKTVLHTISQNSFYYGEMHVKGEYYQHKYEPLITKDVFMECKAVREGWNKKPFKYGGKDYLFRGLLTCATTGKVVTADTKSKTYASGKTAEWTYLGAWNPENPKRRQWVREERVVEQVEDVLKNIGCSNPKLFELAVEAVKETNQLKQSWHDREVAALKKEHTDIQKKLDRLLDLLAEGVIDKDDFKMKKQSMRERQHEVLQLISAHDGADEAFSNAMEKLLKVAQGAYEGFIGSNMEEKRELLNFVFSNLKLKGATLCYSLNFPFNRFEDLSKTEKWLGYLDSNQGCRYQKPVPYHLAIPQP
jgi:site-specific DNA recombinase